MSHGRTAFLGRTMVAVVAAAILGLSASAYAQDGPNTGNVSLSVSADVVTEYWFRGIPQEDQDLIFQPGIDVGVALYSNEDFSIDGYFGVWNSFHSEPTGDADFYYEVDWYTGLTFGLPGNFTLDVAYVALYGPSISSMFAEEIDLTLGYDDSDMWGEPLPGWTGLQPYAMLAFEIDNGSDAGGPTPDQGTYLELGIAPGFTLVQSEDYPIDLAIPVTVGLGLEDYYEHAGTSGTADEDETFGFVDIGVDASMPLSFIPADYGAWSMTAGIHVLFLNEDYIDATMGTGYNDTRVYGKVGLAMEY